MIPNENGRIFKDREIKCECGTVFIFGRREQKFFADSTRLLADPKRCHFCRRKKKAMERGVTLFRT